MLLDQQDVWGSLKALWDDRTSTVRDHLNVVAADFVSPGVFWEPIVNMNVEPAPPDPPVIKGLTAAAGRVSVAFDAPADQGTGPVTSYSVVYATAGRNIGNVTGTSSPITVTGLTNGQEYQFAMQAFNDDGNSKPSAFSDPVTVGDSAPQITHPPDLIAYLDQEYD